MSSIDSLVGSAFGSDDLPVEPNYRSVSKSAVFALVLAVLGLFGFIVAPGLVLPLVGLACGLIAFNTIRSYPDEYTGKGIAMVSIAICAVTLITAPMRHYYVYMTEVPEGYERIDFSLLKSGYNAPDIPPASATELNGKRVFLKGYILSNSVSSKTFKSFVLVPDFATCCLGGEPPMTHKIQVNLTGNQVARWALRRYNLAGTLEVDQTVQQVQNGAGVYYTLKADYIK